MPEFSKSAKTRKRDRDTVIHFPAVTQRNLTTGVVTNVVDAREERYSGKQTTVSEGHPWPPPKGGKVTGDLGGPFETVLIEPRINTANYNGSFKQQLGKNLVQKVYQGPCMIDINPSEVAEVAKSLSGGSSDSSLKKAGTTAISLCAPTNRTSELGTAIAETYREGLPSLAGIPTWRGRTQVAKAAGDEYLNAVFGWLPLLGDVDDVVNTVRHSRDIISQYERDAGKNVRRHFDFPIKRTTKVDFSKAWPRGVVTNPSNAEFKKAGAVVGTLTRSTVMEQRMWFAGCFTYALPTGNDSWSKMYEHALLADHLYGLSPTPDVLWELTPWSWAFDWFSNTGEVMKNLTAFAFQGLAMRYGYLMEETTTRVIWDLSSSDLQDPAPPVPPIEVVKTVKKRIPASPFGFGVGWEGLSPAQLLISTALGITRVP